MSRPSTGQGVGGMHGRVSAVNNTCFLEGEGLLFGEAEFCGVHPPGFGMCRCGGQCQVPFG
jgi:hypothetical protein